MGKRERNWKMDLITLDNSEILLVHCLDNEVRENQNMQLNWQNNIQIKRNYTFLCIGNKGIPIWKDLKSIIRIDKKYMSF